ncbi:hypothetical protein GCM10009835_06330 [Planosporangium flavigriseum]|uniref:Uncharacterized protein n=1 Tax=Planosporangium flavigriseum TaxID=373681 RepID=A0A8J3LW82_9ACTN|nr:hypothetical protein Pfl04_28740 [Planosporangium flavigriseum]
MSAEEALAVRLVNELVPEDELLATADRLATRIARNAPLALRLTKLALAAPPGAHPRFDDVAQAVLFETADKYDHMTAFLERRR